ncbi:MAG: DUF1176 domain-containing protein [Parasphingorhabdus sp.]|nr:DUF1176 domain-containing protein [Parasphingorhabdus sp.]
MQGSFRILGLLGAAVLLAAAAPPKLGEIKTFGDWAVGCDNLLRCEMVSLLPDGAAGEAYDGPVAISRGAGRDDVPVVRVSTDARGQDRFNLIIDGRVAETGTVVEGDYPIILEGAEATSILRPIANGRSMTIEGSTGAVLTVASLKGSAAAMRYIDAKQRRAGTSSALFAKGKRRFRPPVLNLPLIAVAKYEATEAVPEANKIVSLIESSECKDERFDVTEDRAYPLGRHDGVDMALVLVSCGAGAYNFSSMPFIGTRAAGEDWRFTPATFDVRPGWGAEDDAAPMLVNVGWDPKSHRLSSFTKGRGLGDCGASEDFVWDGAMFRLISASAMPECRGSYRWISVWSAKVAPATEAAP